MIRYSRYTSKGTLELFVYKIQVSSLTYDYPD